MKENKILAVFLFLVLSLVMPKNLKSQIVEVGATGGVSYYLGDINPGKHFSQSKMALGGSVRYYQNLRWAFRLQYSGFNLKTSDKKAAYMPERDKGFSSTVNDLALIAEFNFFDYWTGSTSDFISPYIFAGVSVLKHNSVNAEDVATEGNNGQNGEEMLRYDSFSWSVPFGVGVKYSLTKRLGATLEWRIHKTFTDYIDCLDQHEGVEDLHVMGYGCDWYSILGLTISYRFNLPKKVDCYKNW